MNLSFEMLEMIGFEVGGGGRLGNGIGVTKGCISVDRGSKATLPLTIPHHVFMSSAKDSTHRSMEIVLQGSHRAASVAVT